MSYRAWFQKQAHETGLSGWVRNLSDGRVEALIYGDSEKINKMISRAKKGPIMAKVTKIDTNESDLIPENTGFDILPTV